MLEDVNQLNYKALNHSIYNNTTDIVLRGIV